MPKSGGLLVAFSLKLAALFAKAVPNSAPPFP
jgi:hypothetical protein